MGTSITVRNVSQDAHDKLASRAALKGQSLQEYLRIKLEDMANQLDPDEWVAMVRRRKETMESSVTVEKILAWKNMDRP
jgi:antitoxin FitA